MTESRKEVVQCSMGLEPLSNGKWCYNMTMFYPSSADGTFDENLILIDRFNHFISKAEFSSEAEAQLYGTLIVDALQYLVVQVQNMNIVIHMILTATTKVPIPKIVKDDIEKFYEDYQKQSQEEQQDGVPVLPFPELSASSSGKKGLN